MTQDEIIEMVRQSDLGFLLGDSWMMHHELESFAKLAAAKEREECAKEVDSWDGLCPDAEFLADKIRARGQA